MKPNAANCDRWRADWALEELQRPIAGECFPPDIYVYNKAGTDFQNFRLKKGTLTTSVPMPPGHHYYVEVTTVSQDDLTVRVNVAQLA